MLLRNTMDSFESELEKLESLSKRYNLEFNNKKLLLRCFVHDSFVYENEYIEVSNERLEFLGDSVLGLVVSHLLFKLYPDWEEGKLALLKSRLVSSNSLAKRAREMELGDYILLGSGEENRGGRDRTSILADSLEAFIGAIYLDQGFERAFEFIEFVFANCILVDVPKKDNKSCLQEYSQKEFKSLPFYEVVHEEGPPHQRLFTVEVCVNEKAVGIGRGNSKKEAEQNAAKDLLDKLINEKPQVF
ncbi:MAG: ribonuclease III [Vulcanimicrobiota bacterium]